MKNYNVPNAGDYNAPTPHAAQVAQEPFTAPAGNTSPAGGPAHSGFDAMNQGHAWTGTPGESQEAPEIDPGGGWTEST